MLVGDVQGAGGLAARGGHRPRRMCLPNALIKDPQLPPLLAHQLQHEHHSQDLGLDRPILGLDCPPELLLLGLDDLCEDLFVLFEGERRVEVWDQVDELAGGVFTRGEQEVLEAVGQGDLLFGIFLHLNNMAVCGRWDYAEGKYIWEEGVGGSKWGWWDVGKVSPYAYLVYCSIRNISPRAVILAFSISILLPSHFILLHQSSNPSTPPSHPFPPLFLPHPPTPTL